MQEYIDAVVAFVRANQEWAAAVAFIVAFGESFCFLSLLWPGTAILVAISALLAASGVSSSVLLPIILAAGIGGTFGYAVSYWIGLYFKDSIGKIWPFSARPDLIPSGQRFFERHGVFGVFLGHFFGPVRAVIPVVAGMFAMPQIPFQIANVLSAFSWAIGVIAPSFLLVSFSDIVFAFMRDNEAIVLIVMALLAFANANPSRLTFWPSLVLFAALGILALKAGNGFWELLLAGTAGAVLGDLFFFYLGKSHREGFVDNWFVNGETTGLQKAVARVDATGAISVITSRPMGMARAFVPMAAGMQSLSYVQFVPASIVAGLIWSGVLLALRYPLLIVGW